MKEILYYLPLFIVIPLGGAFIVPLASKLKIGSASFIALLVTASLLYLSIISVLKTGLGNAYFYNIGGFSPPFGITLFLDALSALFLFIISFAAFACGIFSVNYMEGYPENPKYYTLLFLMIAGLCGVVLTGDFFNLYVFIEVAAISSYALVAFFGEAEQLEASFKYLVMGSIASAFVLLAVAIIYACCGTVNMAQISLIISSTGMNKTLWMGFSLLIVGFSIKAALVPFHGWLPDAHTSAPASISAMLSGVLIKSVGVYAMIRTVFNVFGVSDLVLWTLMVLGTLSMVVGVLMAIGQWDYKRLLAYHSISQIGYVIFGLGIGTPLGILGGLFHLLNHSVFKSLLFLNSGAVESRTGTRDLKELGGLSAKMPVTSATSLIASMSIAGIPPLNGFWSKLFIIIAGIMSGHYIMSFLAVLVSIVTLASFLKVEKYVYFGRLKNGLAGVKEAPLLMCVAMALLAAACIGSGLAYQNMIGTFLNSAVDVLIKGRDYGRMILGG